MMVEDIYKTLDRITKHIDDMALNKVNIEFLTKQMDKVEKLKVKIEIKIQWQTNG